VDVGQRMRVFTLTVKISLAVGSSGEDGARAEGRGVGNDGVEKEVGDEFEGEC
jgi:hypothetical protein